MVKFARFVLTSVIVLMSLVFYGLTFGSTGISQSIQPTVRLTTDPPLNRLWPFEAESTQEQTPTRLTLQAIEATGRPLESVKWHLQLFTPERNPWLTTDFPVVEGTQLLDLETVTPSGELQVQQMLPIRGNYRLEVDVASTENAFQPFHQVLTLPVHEHWAKYRNAGILVLIMLAAGIGGGWVIGGQQPTRAGEIAPQRVQLLLSGAAIVAIMALVAVNLSSLFLHGHTHTHQLDAQAPSSAQPTQGVKLELLGEPEATVGQLAQFQAQIHEATGQPISNAVLNIQAIALEGGWTAFAYRGITDANGQLRWQQQFFDGAPHQVQVEVLPQPQSDRPLQPISTAQMVDVEAVAPPLLSRLLTLFYWTIVLLLGIAIGYGWRRFRTPPTWRTIADQRISS